MEEVKEQRCNYCKVTLPIHKFSKSRAEKYLKSCDECRVKQKIARENYKCEHGRQKSRCKDCKGGYICEHNREKNKCKECGGASICEHNRVRVQCKECSGASICEHNKFRNTCKKCGGSYICQHNKIQNQCKICTDPIKVTIRNWINASKQHDKKADRYDANNFIDKCFLEGLIEDYPNCFYCNITLQYVEYQEDLATIERIDNSIGHTKANCVICCRSCNIGRIGQRD